MARQYDRREITELPKEALTVSEFTKQHGWSGTNVFYWKLREHKLEAYEVVKFQGLNFVIDKITDNK